MFLVLALVGIHEGACSTISVVNIQLGTLSGGSTNVTFDLTWANSWRTTGVGAPAPNNWDAAWVFIKFRKNGGSWSHASLNDTGHTTGSGTPATIAVGYPDTNSTFNIATNPGVGVFIHRSTDGTGTFSLTGASLSWNYSQDGVTPGDTVDLRVFGIEMTYIPTGSFFAGDNATSTASFKQGSSDNDPWYIGSEAAMGVAGQSGTGTGLGEANGEYYYVSGGNSGESATGSTFTIPAEFPKGYQKFYMMKGPISQSQWVAFFNTLTDSQKVTRDITGSGGKNSDNLVRRNNVSWTGSGDATLPDRGGGATYASVAMVYISWSDIAAYLDWAGLRPMSELEYERAARGPYRAVSGEYAWGSTSVTQATAVYNEGTASESVSATANCARHASGSSSPLINGPMRVGISAYNKATRIESGAGYYGNMDLSCGGRARVITVGNATGRAFNASKHGNGILDGSGDANVSSWPASDAVGTGFRGASWAGTIETGRTSDRSLAASTYVPGSDARLARGVRVAP